MSEEVTLKDIQDALAYYHELPTHRVVYDWGWVEVDALGAPIQMFLKLEVIRDLMKTSIPHTTSTLKGQVGAFMGVPVIISKKAEEENEWR